MLRMLKTKIMTNLRGHENTFPLFKVFSEDDFLSYQKFISPFPQHCDFTLNNLLVWVSGGNTLEYSKLNGNFVFKINDSLYLGPSATPTYTVIGVNKADKTLATIFKVLGIDKLDLVPDYFVGKLKNPDLYSIKEDSDNRDYIIDVNKLLLKQGKEYEGFRYQIKFFLKNYSEEAIVRPLDLSSNSTILDIVNAMHTWPEITSFTPNGNDPHRRDAKAIDKLLNLQTILTVKHQALGVYIDGKLQGFSFYHIPPSKDSIAIGNHIKFNSKYQRLFDFLVYATASNLKSQGVKLLNAEQDMGIEGIRHHKMALNPVTFYEKYTISKK